MEITRRGNAVKPIIEKVSKNQEKIDHLKAVIAKDKAYISKMRSRLQDDMNHKRHRDARAMRDGIHAWSKQVAKLESELHELENSRFSSADGQSSGTSTPCACSKKKMIVHLAIGAAIGIAVMYAYKKFKK